MWGSIINAGLGVLGFTTGMMKEDPKHYVRQNVQLGTKLDTSQSKDMFNYLGKYSEGRNRYKQMLANNQFGQLNKMANTDSMAAASQGMSQLYANQKNTNLYSNRAALQGYLNNKNNSFFKAATKEAQQNSQNYNSLKASQFNDQRFLTSFDNSQKSRDQYGKSLAKSFQYNKEDIQGTYQRAK